jgi:hypothetical protein
MKHVKKINEFRSNLISHEPILEMARINDVNQFRYDVFVYGGDSYGSGRNEHGEPHFHFADKIKTGQWEFSILIPTVEEWKQNKELYIIESKNGDFTWSGYRKQKKQLIEWLDETNVRDTDKTNLQSIRYLWNVLNSDNKNVKQIAKIK